MKIWFLREMEEKHGEKSANISSVSDTAGRICNTVSRLLIADEFDNPEKTSCKVVRVGLLLFGYSYIMYCVEYYPCGGAV